MSNVYEGFFKLLFQCCYFVCYILTSKASTTGIVEMIKWKEEGERSRRTKIELFLLCYFIIDIL